jgi:hypothetical protein
MHLWFYGWDWGWLVVVAVWFVVLVAAAYIAASLGSHLK